MMSFVLIVVSVLAYMLSKRLYHSMLNPVFVFVGVNIFSISLSLFQKIDFEYTAKTTFVVLEMFISFLIGIIFGTRKGFKCKSLNGGIYNANNLRNIIFVFGLIYDFALVGYLQQLFESFSFVEFFLKLNEVNEYVQSEEYKTHWFSYVIPLGMPLFLLCIFYIRNFGKQPLIVIQSVLSILYCLSPRRDSLFNLIMVSFFFLLSAIQNRYNVKIISKYTVIVAGTIILLMSYTQQLLNKTIDETVELETGVLPSSLNSSYLYVSLNYPYLQQRNLDYIDFPDVPFLSSFRLGYNITNRIFGTNIDLQSDFDLDFVKFGPFTTNTAPLLYYSVLDLGLFFFIFFIILGFLSQRAYYSLNSEKVTSRILGAIWFTIIAMSFRGYLIIYLTFALSLVYTLLINQFITTCKLR